MTALETLHNAVVSRVVYVDFDNRPKELPRPAGQLVVRGRRPFSGGVDILPPKSAFYRIGHCLWAWLMAVIGGFMARHFYLAQEQSQAAATFDSIITNGIDLTSYTEGLLSITVPDISFVNPPVGVFDPFADGTTTAFHFGDLGNSDFVTLRGTDSAIFSGLEMKVGDGLSGSNTRVSWEAYLTGSLTGSGTFTVASGTVAGWADDMSGFDELRVIADNGDIDVNASLDFGDFQAIALDDVTVQLAPVPEPTTLIVWSLLGCIGITVGLWRRKRSDVWDESLIDILNVAVSRLPSSTQRRSCHLPPARHTGGDNVVCEVPGFSGFAVCGQNNCTLLPLMSPHSRGGGIMSAAKDSILTPQNFREIGCLDPLECCHHRDRGEPPLMKGRTNGQAHRSGYSHLCSIR